MKKILAILLIALMLLQSAPFSALAEEMISDPEESGVSSNVDAASDEPNEEKVTAVSEEAEELRDPQDGEGTQTVIDEEIIPQPEGDTLPAGMSSERSISEEERNHTFGEDTVAVERAGSSEFEEQINDEGARGTSDAPVTRGQWISELVNVFSMTVEEDNYPDNYYTDISGEDSIYRDIMVAVEFGVIDLEYGRPFYPDDAATREFTASTLVFCLGFQPEDLTYTYTDTVSSADAAQIAINRGWFALSSGEFLPEQAITSTEKDFMLADAQEILAADQFDENHENTVEFADSVIVFPNGTYVTRDESDNILIYNTSIDLAVGDVFGVYYAELPFAFVATSVSIESGHYVVAATTEGAEDAILDLDFEGILPIDLEEFEPSYASSYLNKAGKRVNESATEFKLITDRAGVKRELKASKKITIGSGLSATVDAKLKDISIEYKHNKSTREYLVALNGNSSFNLTVEGSVADLATGDHSVTLGILPVGILGKVSLAFEYDLSGKLVMSWEGALCAGFSFKDGEFRLIREFTKKGFSVAAEATVKAGLRAEAGVDTFFLKAVFYGETGLKATLQNVTYTENTPKRCKDVAGYLYGEIGVEVRLGSKYTNVKWKSYSEVWDKNSSPLRVHYHWEDGVMVPKCTRDKDFKENTGNAPGTYTTDPSSKNFNPGGGNGSSSYTSSNGNTIIVWEYSLDENNNATITKYRGSASAVQVPETVDGYTVVSVGRNAFQGNATIQAITVSDTVTVIGGSAFSGCTALKVITLPNTVTTIGGYAFSGCTALTELFIPRTVEDMGSDLSGGALRGSYVEQLQFEEGITRIPSYAGERATHLRKVILPDTVTEIGGFAFRGCTALETINIPDSVTTIYVDAFAGCTALTEIELPDSVTTIYDSVFASTGLQSLTLPRYLVTLGGHVLEGTKGVTELFIPRTVEDMGSDLSGGALCGSYVEQLQFEEGIARIPGYAGERATHLRKVILPDTVTEIGGSAFSGCTALTEIELPDSITTIFRSAFYGCTSMTEVRMPAFITTVAYGVFQNCESLKSIVLPDTVTTIERSAFSGCINLETINIPEQVTKIDQIAFQNCGLIEISLPTSLKSIGDSAFRNCDSLVSVTVPDSVTSLGTYVFYDCDALTEVRLGTGITKIQESVFEHCDSLESIVLPYRVVSIGNNAFKDCVKLMSVTIPRATTTISDTAFSYYNRLTIYGVAGTYAETYANAKGIRFVDRQVNAITVSFTDADITLNKGASVTLAFHVEPADFTDEVSWRSSDTSVVTVADDGTVKAVNVGTATVKLTVGAKSASCKITVVQPVTSISLNKTSLTMEALDTFRLVATVYPSNAYNREVVWTTSDESVAMVDEVGVVTAQAKGTATITCASADGSNVTRSCTVTVTNTAHIAATVSEMESPHDYEVNSSDFWQYSVEGAESLQICFAPETNVEDGFDYLYVYDGDGILVGKYTGTELAGQTISVPGDTVRIQLVSDSAGTEWGFRVDSIVPVGSGEPMSEFSYTIEDGKATITGYTGEETELVIPNTISGYPVTKIGDGAFIENSSLISVTFPESVTDIGRYAFGYCTNLMSVTIPDSVTVIKRGAFRNCTSLTTIIIPENVTSMEGDVFFWCTGLTTVYYNATDVLGEWGNDEPVFGHAGENTSSGMSVLFGETVRRIPKGLFCFIDDVAPTPEIEDDIPDSILAAVGTQTNREGSRTTLDGDDLASRIIPIRVREVSIPTSVTEIGGFAFYSCTDLKEVYYGGTQTQWSNISIDEYNEPLINAKIHFAVSEQSPAFKSQSLVLSGQIGLNFFLELPEIPGVDYKKSYMTFTIGGSTAEYRDDFDPNHMNSAGTRYGFTCYVNSIQMADTITAVFHYGNGKTVSKEYSVAQYIDFFEKNIGSFNAKTIELIHAIADFGHYEQIYLADVNGWSIGESYAEMAKHYTETYDYSSILSSVTSKAFVKTLGSSNVEKATYKLHLDSETTVDVYLTPKSGTTLTASATFNGKTYTAVKQADGRYLVRIPNISAHQLGDMITVSGTAGSAFTVQVSALSYTRSILNNASSNKAAKDGLSALYAYYTAVLAYRS